MKVGIQMVFQSYGYDSSVTDGQVVAEEVQLGVLADELGFDAVHLHHVGQEQREFIDAFGDHVLPELDVTRP